METRELFTKKPFYRLANTGLEQGVQKTPMPVDSMKYEEKRLNGIVMSQADFVEEYHPSSHKINSEVFFPEHYNYGEVITEDGQKMETMYRDETFRISVPLQAVITVQHLVHQFGNDTHHELTDSKVDADINDRFFQFQTGWLGKGIDLALYQLGRSSDITGDGAIAFFMYKGKLHTKNLSYLDGDSLYPHYDPLTGELSMFVRKFSSYDETGNELISWIEVWDEKYFYRLKQTLGGVKGAINSLLGFFGVDGYKLSEPPTEHGFKKCPIVYYRDRDNGPVWNKVAGLIDSIETALSYWAKACASTDNDAYIIKGDDVSVKGDITGRVRAFVMGKDDDVSLLEKKSAGDYFQAYIERLYKELFRGSFTIEPPVLTSGDKPSAAIKLVYAPSLDKALLDAKDFQPAINRAKELFCEGYGMETKSFTEYVDMNERFISYIIPYVHENTAELVANLVALKGAGLMSTETGCEHNPYTTNAEADKLMREKKQEQAADRLYQLKSSQQTQTEE